MSGEQRRPETPQGPPWSLDLVADLHAGVLDQDVADELLPRIQADPEASELLAALEATSAELAELPAPTVPDDVAAKLDEALEAELRSWAMAPEGENPNSAGTAGQPVEPEPAPVLDLAAARRRRRKRAGWTAGLLTAAAAVTGIVVLGTGGILQGDTDNAAAPPPQDGPPPLALRGDAFPADRLGEALGSEQYGALADPEQLLGCLQANGVSSGNPLGAREVTIDGEPARALVLQGGGIGRFRILVVGQDCGPDRPATISDSTLGG
ncbi:hypothetical protein GCM10027271_10420 [Saccharopolyspora gloriosae]|uniref:Anti-sigma-M factor RsmA n=1 Tax=Saccharopolyspora gloriosae TaxID=455344 RepID=A0A840NRE3_9PSEU|nr:hypothetical protein [Saccharopolyspora gloriosae]MBB5072583.1 hypothetical protein [Saccharopolyspora gloriosae]